MLRTVRKIFSQDKEKFRIPKSVQHVIPIETIWKDGIFKVGRNKYSKTFQFTDINYAIAGREDQEKMFQEYNEILNAFDSNATMKITINNRKLNKKQYEKNNLLPMKGDRLDVYREEYNEVLTETTTGSYGTIQEKYITVSIYKKNIEEARNYFARIGAEFSSAYARLGSKCRELDAVEKLQVLHDFYRMEHDCELSFDLKEAMRRGHSFKDVICPDSMEFDKDYFKIGERYGRVLYLREYASFIKDSTISQMTEGNQNLMLSIDVITIPTEEAIREVNRLLLGVNTNITNFQRKQNENDNFSATIPFDLAQQKKELLEVLEDLTTRDKRLMLVVVTLVHTADSKEELDRDTENLLAIGRNCFCEFTTLRFQQLDGINTALPIGQRKIDVMRTLTSEGVAALMPFRVQEIMDEGGIFAGVNKLSHNPIFCNKAKLMNPNAFLFGVSGSGKSFSAKTMITYLALATEDDILVCDPEREYGALIEAFGGEVIHISAGSEDHINAMDMVEGYGDSSNSIIDKSEFILALFEHLENGGVTAKEKSIIDRCISAVYRESWKEKRTPTLCDLRDKLMEQPEEEGLDLALRLELFTSGNLNVFAHETNVKVDNRMIVYDILDLGEQLKTMGLLVITDAMMNRVAENWKKGKRTHVFIDEIHVIFENEYSANFFSSAWRRWRKRNAFPTAITQNVSYILDSPQARIMLSNSEYIVMLNQAEPDREKLATLLNISQEQMNYITNADVGDGLIKYGSSLVPFVNKFPKDTNLYRLMTTKPGEDYINRNR